MSTINTQAGRPSRFTAVTALPRPTALRKPDDELAPITDDFQRVLLHDARYGFPAARLAFSDTRVTPIDVAIAERLIRAFDAATAEEAALTNRPYGDVWETVASEFHREIVDVLKTGNAATLADFLSTAWRRNVTHGLGPGHSVFEFASTPAGNAKMAAMAVDHLATLAEAVGALAHENPEQGDQGVNLYIDPAELLGRVETVLGVELLPAQSMGYFGVPIRDGLFYPRTASAIYVAWRCRALGASEIVEIGAGLGAVGDYAMRLGATSYAIYDLPVTNVLQGCTLLSAGHQVSLLGEPPAPVTVRPWWHLESAPAADLVVNQDSFPEINGHFVLGYLKQIRRISRLFLSINQESGAIGMTDGSRQHIVFELIAQVPGFRRLSRSPYWLRRGYIEEVYSVDGASR